MRKLVSCLQSKSWYDCFAINITIVKLLSTILVAFSVLPNKLLGNLLTE